MEGGKSGMMKIFLFLFLFLFPTRDENMLHGKKEASGSARDTLSIQCASDSIKFFPLRKKNQSSSVIQINPLTRALSTPTTTMHVATD